MIINCCYSTYLKPSHIPRIAGILQTILVALKEEFEKKSVTNKNIIFIYTGCVLKFEICIQVGRKMRVK